jgi:hypothetical protein
MLLCKSGDGLVFFHVSTIIEMMYACQQEQSDCETSRAIKRSGRSSQRCALARLAIFCRPPRCDADAPMPQATRQSWVLQPKLVGAGEKIAAAQGAQSAARLTSRSHWRGSIRPGRCAECKRGSKSKICSAPRRERPSTQREQHACRTTFGRVRCFSKQLCDVVPKARLLPVRICGVCDGSAE